MIVSGRITFKGIFYLLFAIISQLINIIIIIIIIVLNIVSTFSVFVEKNNSGEYCNDWHSDIHTSDKRKMSYATQYTVYHKFEL